MSLKAVLGPKGIVPTLFGLAVLIIGVVLIAPIDRVLGETTRVVYVHGAIIRVVLGTFLIAGLLGLGFLLNKRTTWYEWSCVRQETSLLLWIPYLISSVIATLQSWGAIAWFEPRWVVTLQISAVAPVAYLVALIVKNRSVTAILNIVVAALIFVLTRNAGLVLHPIDPIGASGDVRIIGSYLILLGLCVLFALQVARGLRMWHQARLISVHSAS